MGTLSDGHCPLLVHSSKLLPLIMALEILYTWDGDYALVRPGVLHRVVPVTLVRPGVTLGDLANGGLALVWPCVLHSMVPVALEDPDLETWYWRGPCMTQRGPSDSEDLGD